MLPQRPSAFDPDFVPEASHAGPIQPNLHTLGQLTSDARWSEAADRIRDALLRVAWDNKLGQFDQGFSPGGQRDTVRALDCASWGSLFLLAIGESSKAQQAIRHIDQYYASRDGDAVGYRPYFDDRIFPGFEWVEQDTNGDQYVT